MLHTLRHPNGWQAAVIIIKKKKKKGDEEEGGITVGGVILDKAIDTAAKGKNSL